MTNEELIARECIRDALSTYNIHGDEGRIDELMEVFGEDSVLEIPGEKFSGGEAMRKFFDGRKVIIDQSHKDNRPMRHYLATSNIEVSGPDAAKATTYFLVVRNGVTEQMGTYFDSFVRTGDRWLIKYRNVVLHWMVNKPA
jgi:hypothetical protein